MTEPDPLGPLSDAFFDRIVDGGLSPAELRGALDRLGREPDGWKRCALAFLEAQSWRESFRAIDGETSTSPGGTAPRHSPGPHASRRPPPGWRRVAMAAGIAAISFALGWQSQPRRLPTPTPGASATVAGVKLPVPTAAATMDHLPRPPGDLNELARVEPVAPRPTPLVVTVGQLRLGPADDAPVLPIVAGPGIDERWVRNQPPPLTEHQRALLEQRGYQVDQHRRLITATLADGRRVTVPVDQVQIRYTGIEPL